MLDVPPLGLLGPLTVTTEVVVAELVASTVTI
jgi:hypothetical protein